MNILKSNTLYLLPLLFILLVACEGSTESTWSVSNETSDFIEVKAKQRAVTDTIYELIEAGDASIITIISDDSGNGDPLIPYDIFSFFEVKNAGGEVMEKDYTDRSNWEIFIEQTKKNPDHWDMTYELIVRSQDF